MENNKCKFSPEDYLGVKNIIKKDIVTNNNSKSAFSLTLKSKTLNNELDVGSEKDTLQKPKEFFGSDNNCNTMHAVDNCLNIGQNLLAESSVQLSEMQKENTMQTIKNASTQMQNSDISDSKGNKNISLIKFNSIFKNLQISKVFANKNSKIALMVVILSIILVAFLNLNTGTKTNFTNTSAQNFNSLEYVSSTKYINELEDKLISVLSKVKGAGQVNVMITLETGPELKIATSVDERTNTSTSSSTTTTSVTVIENPIIITQNGQSQPLVLMEIMPKIKGVIVVAQGAGSTKVKLELLEAIQALLDVTSNNIQIYAGI